jgi:hypothetical protein
MIEQPLEARLETMAAPMPGGVLVGWWRRRWGGRRGRGRIWTSRTSGYYGEFALEGSGGYGAGEIGGGGALV